MVHKLLNNWEFVLSKTSYGPKGHVLQGTGP